jgi:hypothetical protein
MRPPQVTIMTINSYDGKYITTEDKLKEDISKRDYGKRGDSDTK